MIEQLLDGAWTLSATKVEDNSFGIKVGDTYSMTIPGDVHNTLIEGGILPDPYYGTNELDVLFLGRADWTIERKFLFKKEEARTFLLLEKIDTVARLFLNGRLVSGFTNEHHIHYINVTEYLKEGENTISFVFRSAEDLAIQRNSQLAYPIPCSRYPNDSPNRNLVRKTQCNAGWDWGPCIMSCGIHESVRLVQTGSSLFESFAVIPEETEKNWNVHFELLVEAEEDGKAETEVAVAGKSRKTELFLQKGTHIYTVNLEVGLDDVERWWPNGVGGQPLYTAEARVHDAKKERKTAFRTIVVKNEITMGGKELTVTVNGKPIFMKGANWIPLDAIPSRMNKERFDHIIQDAKNANMNMLRVWGGGWYEKEDFYDACDRMGILLWHDMMFACSTYPADDWFLKTVERELRDQIRRIKSHPCIALYCGNNEDLGALGWYEETRADLQKYVKDYLKLNEDTVGRVVMEEDPSRIFWPSSPCAGPGDFSDNWHNDGNGDMHYWTVWHEGKDFSAYYDVKPRFCSEFGYQSFSSIETVRGYCPEDQESIESEVMMHHQKNDAGNQIISSQFERQFRYPCSFEGTLYLSQVQQALAIETAVTYWRSLAPYCMGTLFWQLNDVWPVASWSSVEYNGKWKALHYAAKHFYTAVTPLLYRKDGKIYVYVGNDTLEEKTLTVNAKVMTYSGTVVKACETVVTAPSMHSVKAMEFSEEEFDSTKCFLVAETNGETRTLLLSLCKDAETEEPMIDFEVEDNDDGSYTIRLNTDKPAFYVMVSSSYLGSFSDNNLTLLPGKDYEIIFTPNEKKEILDVFESISIWDVTQI